MQNMPNQGMTNQNMGQQFQGPYQQNNGNKKNIIVLIISAFLVAVIALGGVWYYMGHAVGRVVPGHVFKYNSVSGDKMLYITFAQKGDKVVVSQTKEDAMKADKSQADFDKAYAEQSKSAQWLYRAEGRTLTLAQTKSNNEVSQWQYNKTLSSSKKITSSNFGYQIAKAGEGQVNKRTVFERID